MKKNSSKLKEKVKKKLPEKREKEKSNKNKNGKKAWKSVLNVLLVIAIGIISIGLVFALYIVLSSPDFDKDKLYQKEPTILYDKNGNEFARVGEANATIVTYDEIPDVLIDALVATEDSRFFQHNGIDLFRFIKASVLQLLGQGDAGGASTLDMQVIKNTYTQTDQNTGPNANKLLEIIRKFQDVYMSVFKLEAKYTKEEIIEFYLNTFRFSGGNINYKGTYGIEQACQYFFGKSSKDINLAEASLIAGMFQGPSKYNPFNNPEDCKARQKTVLSLMVRHGYITEEQMNDVLAIPIESLLTKHDDSDAMAVESNQAFIDYVIREIYNKTGIIASEASLKIYTTFDPSVQAVIEKAEKGDLYEYPDEKMDEGIAVTSTKDGSIVALSGGRDYSAKGTINAVDMINQPGSTAKPLVDYAMYIEHITKGTYSMLLDEPTTYSTGQSIGNYDLDYDGLVTMRYAIKDSRNIPALLVFKKVAALDQKLIENFLKSVNINYGDYLKEAHSIGGFDEGVSPLDMSAAYAAFGRGGYYIKPYSYTKFIDTLDNNREYTNSYTKVKVMEETTASLVTNLLLSAYSGYKTPSNTDVAGKTGTTNLDDVTKDNYNLPSGAILDMWMMSYSPSYSIGMWIGYDTLSKDSKENKWYLTTSSGNKARRAIMNGLSAGIHKKNEHFTFSKNIINVNVEKETFPAQLCSPYTPEDMCLSEWFVKGAEPTEVSSRYNTLDNPTNGSYTYSGNTITLHWDAIKTPEAIDPVYLDNFYKINIGETYAKKYYDERIKYNNTTFGNLGYRIYLVNADGSETEIGYTNTNSFIYNVTSGGEYNFKVKASYSIFKNNMSSGLVINTKTIDSNVNDWVDDNNQGNNPPEPENPDTGLN